MSSEQLRPYTASQLWDKVCTTDTAYAKAVNFGKRRFTSIDPTYQNKVATELWGPQGKSWGLSNITYDIVSIPVTDDSGKKHEEMSVIMRGVFFYPDGVIEMLVDMPFRSGQDTMKKARTSIISKALAQLGFSADVYLGRFDDAAYVSELKERQTKGRQAIDRLSALLNEATLIEQLDQYARRAEALMNSKQINGASFDELMELVESRRADLLGEGGSNESS